MIKKERLEELMKNNGKIYHIIEFNGECAVEKNKAVDFNAVDLLYSLMNGDKNKWFETKEEAEWELEFGNITRTETLKLPSWEEFCKVKDLGFYGATHTHYHIFSDLEWLWLVQREDDEEWSYDLFCERATKDNYIEACKLAKKLFLGEVE